MNIEIQNTPQNIVSLVTPKLKLLPEFFSDIVPASASGEKVGFMNTVGLPLRFIDVATEIVAQQNLNGYDHPWAGGGGDNKIGFADGTYTSGSNKSLYVADGLLTVQASASVSSATIATTSAVSSSALGNTFPAGTYMFSMFDYAYNVVGILRANIRFEIKLADETTQEIAENTAFTTTQAFTLNTIKSTQTISWTNGKYISFRLMLVSGSTQPTEWTPYSNICPITGFNTGNIIVSPTENQGDSTTYIVAWHSEAGTVYGGEVDVTKGKLTVTHWAETFDGSEADWVWYGAYQQIFHALTNTAKYIVNDVTAICDKLKPVANNNRVSNIGNYAALVSSGASVAFSVPETTEENAKTWLSNHPVTFVYELATPVEYDITPVDAIKMLNGQNFVWSNTGDISIVYYKKAGVNDNVQTLMRSVAPSLGMERQEVEDRPLDDIRFGDGLMREVREPIDELEPIEREEIEDEPAEIAEEEPQEEA